MLTTGLTAAAGLTGLGTFHMAGRNGLIPPDHFGLFGVGETLTYAAQRTWPAIIRLRGSSVVPTSRW